MKEGIEMKKFFTSESVTEGHPDKLCDYISDSILDAYLEQDENSRVACETVASKGEVIVTGEITSKAENIDIEKIVRQAICEVGYNDAETGIDYETCKVHVNICKQSPDIALGTNDEIGGAGDQGMMFGYACDETEEYMPLAISVAHKLAKRLTEVRKQNIIHGLKPDGKTQVTVEYNNEGPTRIDTIVISAQHSDTKDLEELKKEIIKEVIDKVIPSNLLDEKAKYYINPTGRFVIGGPLGDSGLTGRKIIVDTYGGYSRHGGGAFSGKDATKVDRSATYMARHLAKNIVANGYARKCEIQLSYAIGIAEPVSIFIETFGTATIPEEEIMKKIKAKFNLTPKEIIKYLGLKAPIYKQTTNYGHFGKENMPWEKIIEL
jgi:S-adenosylmethionine synthetase